MDQQMGLLDRLAQMSGCVCLSDLRTPAYRHPVVRLEAVQKKDQAAQSRNHPSLLYNGLQLL